MLLHSWSAHTAMGPLQSQLANKQINAWYFRAGWKGQRMGACGGHCRANTASAFLGFVGLSLYNTFEKSRSEDRSQDEEWEKACVVFFRTFAAKPLGYLILWRVVKFVR